MDKCSTCKRLGSVACDHCSEEDMYSPYNGTALMEAYNIVNGERNDLYGKPEDSFTKIAEYWTAYLGREVSARDVALMMALFKIAREQNQHKRDNIVDGAAYLALAGDM